MLRFIPMFVTGISLNVTVALIIHRVPMVWLLGDYSSKMQIV